MTYFVILHKPSGKFFPAFKAGRRRGSTYIKLPFKGVPRLFSTKTGATNCLKWWLAGEAKLEYDYFEDGRGCVGASLGKGDPNRKAEDMAIIEANIILTGLKVEV